MSILSQKRWDRLKKLVTMLKEKHPNLLSACDIYVIDDAMHVRAGKWIEEHNTEKHKGKTPYAGAIGGAHAWIFMPTGLGVITCIKCMCGAEGNLTDWKTFG